MLNYSIFLVESEGGLFDFDATLPFMALQIILLTFVLNILFYGPVTKILDDRNTTIRNNLKEASITLVKAEEITKQYEEQLRLARDESQGIIIKARKEANEFVASQIEEGQLNAEKLVNETTQQLLLQKEQTLQTLEAQLDALSDDIKKKLLTVSVIS
jgi:F-type H+-transporting ATPase subunit b|tara:strand:+ start:13623 stop:14096 length:474 start_codon:yes stop_codon:yes gene_type:complete